MLGHIEHVLNKCYEGMRKERPVAIFLELISFLTGWEQIKKQDTTKKYVSRRKSQQRKSEVESRIKFLTKIQLLHQIRNEKYKSTDDYLTSFFHSEEISNIRKT